MVKLLQELAPDELGRSGGEKAARKHNVTADERSNRLILRGDQTFRDKMRGLIRQLHQPSATGGTISVIRLRHPVANVLTVLLKGVMGEVAREAPAASGT